MSNLDEEKYLKYDDHVWGEKGGEVGHLLGGWME